MTLNGQQFSCPSCGEPMRLGYKVTTGRDGQARLTSARRPEGRGVACRSCTLPKVDAANSPEEITRKAAVRLAARDARVREPWTP